MVATAERREVFVEFQELVYGRRSIRGYKPDVIPRETLDEIIEAAAQSPSSMNTQPWYVHVVAGDVLDRIRAGNTERMIATGKPDREIRGHGRYEGDHFDIYVGDLFERAVRDQTAFLATQFGPSTR